MSRPNESRSLDELLKSFLGPLRMGYHEDGKVRAPEPPPVSHREKAPRWRSNRSIDREEARANLIEAFFKSREAGKHKLTNWQRHQWVRAGRKVKRLAEFAELEHP